MAFTISGQTAEVPFAQRRARAKKTFEPEMVLDWRMVEEDVGPAPRRLTDEEIKSLSDADLLGYLLYHAKLVAYLKALPTDVLFFERLILFDVHPDLTGDLSGLYGDASGLHGRVNPGTTGNVTGLTGSLENVWGDVSNVWGRINRTFCGTVTELRGDISRCFGYCSDATGDVSRFRGDLTPLEGDLTGLSGSTDYYRVRQSLLGPPHRQPVAHFRERRLKNFRLGQHQGDWSRCWGDATNVRGRNDGFIGDVSAESGDVTGRRGDTACVGSVSPEWRVVQWVIPFETGSDSRGMPGNR